MIYLVSYELHDATDRIALEKQLGEFRASVRIMPMSWLVQSSHSTAAIAAQLGRSLAPGARLLVTELARDVAWKNLCIPDETMRRWQSTAVSARE